MEEVQPTTRRRLPPEVAPAAAAAPEEPAEDHERSVRTTALHIMAQSARSLVACILQGMASEEFVDMSSILTG